MLPQKKLRAGKFDNYYNENAPFRADKPDSACPPEREPAIYNVYGKEAFKAYQVIELIAAFSASRAATYLSVKTS